MRKNIKLGLGLLTVLATPLAVNAVDGHEVQAEYRGNIFYANGQPANWWYSDGKDWFFFQNGKKLTGVGRDNAGSHYFVNGKYANGVVNGKTYKDGKEVATPTIPVKPKNGYVNGLYYVNNRLANWWYDDGQDWYFFQNGKKLTGQGRDNAGVHNFVNGKYAKETVKEGYVNGLFYVKGQLANWWYYDGQDWYFFQNGKKLTGQGRDNAGVHNFVNGKYAKETVKEGYVNGLFYVKGQLANWWYSDGKDWYFFKDGKKLTGEGKDNAGSHYFVNGKYANGTYNGKTYKDGKETKVVKEGYVDGLFYVKGEKANWWYSDGKDWYFFKDGKKLTGEGRDNAGSHYFVNGKYATGTYNNKTYVDGKEVKAVQNGYSNGLFFANGKLANWWYNDGKDWYFFQNGKKYTGKARDNAGEHNFINGKYANNNLDKVLDLARSYLGVQTGTTAHKKIVDAYNSVNPKPVGYTAKYNDDWCDIFVTTVFQQAGLSNLIGRECGVQRHIGIMQQKGIWQGRTTPKVGDVVTFDWDGGGWADHIGIVESVNNGVITTIEGNSSQYAGQTAPTKVNRKTYDWNSRYIKGYARPAY